MADNGIGIAPDMLANVFEMFVQVDSTLERTNAGLGVGLSLARRLVELHHGTIEAHSAGIGRGSEFTVRLPIVVEPELPTKTMPAAFISSETYRILLADDNVDFVNSIGALLSAMGHSVVITHNGPDALTAAARFCPDFAFLDIGLPQMSGYDLARGIRAPVVRADDLADRGDRLGPGKGPPAGLRGRLRPPHGQAGALRADRGNPQQPQHRQEAAHLSARGRRNEKTEA